MFKWYSLLVLIVGGGLFLGNFLYVALSLTSYAMAMLSGLGIVMLLVAVVYILLWGR